MTFHWAPSTFERPVGLSESEYQRIRLESQLKLLNGPQGTLYGATYRFGAAPSSTFPMGPDLKIFRPSTPAVEVSSTEHGHINHAYTGMVNMPIADIAAIRIDGYQVYDSGYAKDPIYGRDETTRAGLGREGRFELRLFAPSPRDDLDNITLRRVDSAHSQVKGADGSGFRDPKTHQARPTATYDQAYPTFQPSDYSLDSVLGRRSTTTRRGPNSVPSPACKSNNGTSYTDK